MQKLKAKLKSPYTWINLIIMAVLTSLTYLHQKPSDVTSWAILFSVAKDIISNPYACFLVAWGVWMEFHDLPENPTIEDTEKLLDSTTVGKTVEAMQPENKEVK